MKQKRASSFAFNLHECVCGLRHTCGSRAWVGYGVAWKREKVRKRKKIRSKQQQGKRTTTTAAAPAAAVERMCQEEEVQTERERERDMKSAHGHMKRSLRWLYRYALDKLLMIPLRTDFVMKDGCASSIFPGKARDRSEQHGRERERKRQGKTGRERDTFVKRCLSCLCL